MNQACCICFDINCKLYPMTAHRILKQTYETLTGISDEDKLSKCLCHKCARRLVACSQFRTKCLQAHKLLSEVWENNDNITIDTIKINELHTQMINDSNQYDIDRELLNDVQCEDNILNRLLNEPINNIKTENIDYTEINENDDMANKDIINENGNMINKDEINGSDNMINEDITNDKELFYVETLDLLTIKDEMASTGITTECNTKTKAGLIPNLLDSHLPKIISTETREDTINDDLLGSGLLNLIDDNTKVEIDNDEMMNYNYELVYDDMENDAVENEDCPDDISQPPSSPLRRMRSHSSEKPNSCTECPKKVSDKKKFIEHSETCSRSKYSCDMCKKIFIKETILRRHIMRVHPSKKAIQLMTCNVCNEKFSSKHKFNIHLNKHFRKNKNTCYVCNKLFNNNRALNMHLVAAHKDNSYSCHICKEEFTGIEGLQAHLVAHSKDTKLTCDYCNRKFVKRSSLIVHLRTHAGEIPHSITGYTNTFSDSSTITEKYICDKCKREFNKKLFLVLHLRTHEKPFKCNICEKSCTTKGNLNTHLETHKAVKTRVCEVCGKIVRVRRMWRHLLAHRKEKSYSCQICMKSFNRKTRLQKHKKTHAISYSCKICNKSIKYKHALLLHLKLHDGEKVCEKAFSCVVCKASYATKAILRRHFRNHKVDSDIAPGDKFYVCEVCSQAFREQRELDKHLSSHKPNTFMCDICKRSFPAKFNLYKHMIIHSDKKPFSCKTCGKAFSRKFSLVQHMALHSNVRPYSCDICKRSYNTKHYLRRHIMDVHLYRKNCL